LRKPITGIAGCCARANDAAFVRHNAKPGSTETGTRVSNDLALPNQFVDGGGIKNGNVECTASVNLSF
jgi:hypothetical protein